MAPRIILILFLCNFALNAQTPHLSGKVSIDLKNGLIQADLKITGIPAFEDPVFVLHKGFNVQYLKADGVTIGYNTDYGLVTRSPFLDAGLAYSPDVDGYSDKTIFEIKYTGAFPVYDGNQANNAYSDSQVNIAFKNQLLRASYLTKWYPFIYDRTSNALLTNATYDLDLTCNPHKAAIYINGCPPAKGSSLKVRSDFPHHLSLYVGKYDFDQSGPTYFLNTTLSRQEKAGIGATAEKINRYYETTTGQRSPQHYLALAQIFSVGRPDQYANWALAEYPCVLFNLNQLSDKLDPLSQEIADIQTFKILAHEIAHQYWGLKVQPNNRYWGFFSESLAEYFALKAVERFFGKEAYKSFLKDTYLQERFFTTQVEPLDRIGQQVPVNRWYYYYPMVLIGLEEMIGSEKSDQIYRQLLAQAGENNADFDLFRRTAAHAGVTEQEWDAFYQTFVQPANCLRAVLGLLESR